MCRQYPTEDEAATILMHHRDLNRGVPLQLFAAAALAVVLVLAAGYAATTLVAPAGKAMPTRPSEPSLPITAPISEDEANNLVWFLPEVQATAEQLRSRGSRPITYTVTSPLPDSTPGSRQAIYVINFAEDRGGHVTTVDTFEVDPYTKHIAVYDVIQDSTISLEQWRASRPR